MTILRVRHLEVEHSFRTGLLCMTKKDQSEPPRTNGKRPTPKDVFSTPKAGVSNNTLEPGFFFSTPDVSRWRQNLLTKREFGGSISKILFRFPLQFLSDFPKQCLLFPYSLLVSHTCMFIQTTIRFIALSQPTNVILLVGLSIPVSCELFEGKEYFIHLCIPGT